MTSKHFDSSYGKTLYSEVDRWSISVWLLVLLLDLSIVFAIWAALDLKAVFVATAVVSTLSIWAFQKSSLRITVTQGWLLVGPAAIERAFIYDFQPLDKNQLRLESGRGANPLNYLQLRFWVKTGMKIAIRDPRDKTPAWIFSSKNGDRLKEVLEKVAH